MEKRATISTRNRLLLPSSEKPKNMKTTFSILTAFLLLISVSCSKDDHDPSLDSYLFLEQHTTVSGELISGPEPPLLQIDFPTYTFDETTGILDGVINFTTDDKLKMIYGSGTCLSGTAGGGCGTGLTGVYSVPFQRGTFELLKLDEDGNVVFMYNNEVHDLKPGEEWSEQTTRLDTVMVDTEISISSITTTERMKNYGFREKVNIQKWEW